MKGLTLLFGFMIFNGFAGNISKPSNGDLSYLLEFNGDKTVTRYGNRYDQEKLGTMIYNTHVRNEDLIRTVELINKKDLFKGGLNEHFPPGYSKVTGAKLKKRTQKTMDELDPNVMLDSTAVGPIKTEGYSTYAIVNFEGLQLGDSVLFYSNNGDNTERIRRLVVIDKNIINSYGKASMEIDLGEDQKTSTYFGLEIRYGSHTAHGRYDDGDIGYNIKVKRVVGFEESVSSKPISKRRAKRRG